ncbi:MAG TPA: acyltransferase family protein [Mycobacteriales bacterium]|nr:acyltransferase family protein [Mycobacteriales bacterium]
MLPRRAALTSSVSQPAFSAAGSAGTAEATRETTPAVARPTSGLAYRPALDGVRAVAVYLVFAFHAGVAQLAGGFIGVDVFFVLSGYLVTRLILTDLSAGTFRIADFYGRRVRRLLPAALFVLAAVSVVWLAIASPYDRAAIAPDVRSAALYVSNWHFAEQAVDYFAANNNPTPVLHFWSLSVEEQFYLAWPLMVLLVWRLSRSDPRSAARRLTLLAALAAAASLVSLVTTLRHGQADLAYFGTHTRAYQLLAGALLAIGVQSRGQSRAWAGAWARAGGGALAKLAALPQLCCLVLLVGLGTSLVSVDPSLRGVGAAAAATGLLLTLELQPAGATARLLSRPSLAYLGQISYATYLWHYPVIVILRRFVEIGPVALLVTAGLLATGLAALSRKLLELPVRQSPTLARHGRAVAVTGLLASVLAGTVLLPPLLHSTRRPIVQAAATSAPPVGSEGLRTPLRGFDVTAASAVQPGTAADGPLPADASCTRGQLAQCVVVRGAGKRVLLMGDSHAAMLLPAFRALAKREGFTLVLAVQTGCPWPMALVFTSSNHDLCQQTKTIWYSSVIPRLNPDLIVLATRATDHAVGASYSVTSVDPATRGGTQSELLARGAEQTVRRLVTPGREIVVVEPVPISPTHAVSCVSGAEYADQCGFTTDAGPSPAELAYRGLAASLPGVHAIDLDPIVCPRLPICDAVIAGTMVRKDHDHITGRYSALISDQIDVLLHTVGAI